MGAGHATRLAAEEPQAMQAVEQSRGWVARRRNQAPAVGKGLGGRNEEGKTRETAHRKATRSCEWKFSRTRVDRPGRPPAGHHRQGIGPVEVVKQQRKRGGRGGLCEDRKKEDMRAHGRRGDKTPSEDLKTGSEQQRRRQ